MNVAVCYFAYLFISIALTVWVARTLHKNGRIFLIDAFHGNTDLADSVNHLLVVGFYLINVGYIALALKTQAQLNTLREVIEMESVKIGVVLLILGAMHSLQHSGLCKDAPPPHSTSTANAAVAACPLMQRT